MELIYFADLKMVSYDEALKKKLKALKQANKTDRMAYLNAEISSYKCQDKPCAPALPPMTVNFHTYKYVLTYALGKTWTKFYLPIDFVREKNILDEDIYYWAYHCRQVNSVHIYLCIWILV
jgi:hypothetical protein